MAREITYPNIDMGDNLNFRPSIIYQPRCPASPSILIVDANENFAILGELVELAWPSLKRDDKYCNSGTSYATLIAVAVAAGLLQ